MTIASDNSETADTPLRRGQYSLAWRIRKSAANISRWLHIYLSMASFAAVFFFSATGITLNHAEWFSHQTKTKDYRGNIPASLLHEPNGPHPDRLQPDRLGIVELLRNSHKIHGSVSDFRVDDSQISMSFKAPGYEADVFINTMNGSYDLVETASGFVAVINDLHRGRDTGQAWSILIDVTALLLVLVSLTGLVLIWFVYKRRTAGLILAIASGALCLIVYLAFVP